MEACEVKFRIWAESQAEADRLSQALQDFVNENGQAGRAITAEKTAEALEHWEDNFLVRSKIINYYTK